VTTGREAQEGREEGEIVSCDGWKSDWKRRSRNTADRKITRDEIGRRVEIACKCSI